MNKECIVGEKNISFYCFYRQVFCGAASILGGFQKAARGFWKSLEGE